MARQASVVFFWFGFVAGLSADKVCIILITSAPSGGLAQLTTASTGRKKEMNVVLVMDLNLVWRSTGGIFKMERGFQAGGHHYTVLFLLILL